MQTFLFTDIEGSTRLWEENGESMAGALARHDAILGDAVNRAGGQVLKTTGDGIIAVFESPIQSVGAAIASQQSLLAEEWATSGPLRVRMGIHLGEAESRDGDYFGMAMNRAARIMAASHGGQVLMSGVAAAEVEDLLPSDVILRDLGSHRLKDLTLPEHLYQVVRDDLVTEFPPPLTLDARPHNLPQQATEFLGRADELAAIQVMLDSPGTRLLTIAGPGGAGKTRLGLQVAAEQVDRFKDGVFFVDLSAEREPDAAYEAIGRGLELPMSGGNPLRFLEARLRDRQILLLLDNFEQVTAAAVGLSELLQQAPDLKILVTSRETLRIRAEKVFPVPPLALPHPNAPATEIAESEAVRLFTDRARAVSPGFSITEENATVIAEICLRLDGLPLAIELAAARLNVFTPVDLRDRLHERLDVLGAGGRDLPDRQRTLWGAIGWSYELLDESEREMFEMMSVFSTTSLVSFEAVASAVGVEFVVDALASLVDKSLARADDSEPTRRFSMLLMIKEYAESRLAENPEREGDVRRAHAAHFSDLGRRLAERLRSEDRSEALDKFEAESGNLRTAWSFWVEDGHLGQTLGLVESLWALHEAKGWYRAAIEIATDAVGMLEAAGSPRELLGEELTLRSSLARAMMAVRGYTPEVEAEFTRALAISDVSGAPADRYPVLRALATYYTGIAQFDKGVAYGKELLALGEETGDLAILVDGHYIYGTGLAFTGDLENGLPHIDRAIELHDPRLHHSARFRLGPNTGVTARTASGLLLWQCGALEQAVARLAEALDVAREMDHPYSIAYAFYHNGYLALYRSRFDDALQRAHELKQVSEENEYPVWATLATVLEGVAMACSGRAEEGLALTEQGIDLYQGLTAPPVFWPQILMLRALVHSLAGKPHQGLALIDEAIALAGPDDLSSAEFWVAKGDFLRMLPETDPSEAEDAYLSATRSSRAGGLYLIELRALTRLVTLRRESGIAPDGTEDLGVAYGRFHEGFDEHDLVEAKALLS